MARIKRIRDMLHGIASYNDLEMYARVRISKLAGQPTEPQEAALQPYAFINGGRWLVHCLTCYAGVHVDPEWMRVVCIDCGTIMRPVYPSIEDVAAIEAELELRGPDNQNWVPEETVEQLRIDNRAHGVSGMP